MGARPVRVVTDSTSYLPSVALDALPISVVPLQVSVDGAAGAEGLDVSPSDVAVALRSKRAVSTSLPTPISVVDAITEAAADGHDVCVVHLSSALSGTYAATQVHASRIASELGVQVSVIDSRQVAMGLGFVVLAAARAAAEGSSIEEVAAAAEIAIGGVSVYFLVDTLEYLRRGGRLSASQALVGSALAIKPILEVRDGEVVAKEKVRTASKALSRLEKLAIETAAGAPVRLAVHHLAAPTEAQDLADKLAGQLELIARPIVSEVGAVVGAHAGPGLLGVVVSLA